MVITQLNSKWVYMDASLGGHVGRVCEKEMLTG